MNQPQLDCRKKFVRVTGTRNDRFVEFDFAIAEPELFVEMILPLAAFEAFCAANDVIRLDEETGALLDADKREWRHGDGGGLRQR